MIENGQHLIFAACWQGTAAITETMAHRVSNKYPVL